MKKFADWLQKVENAIMILAFLGMLGASFAQVINRNLIHAGIGWFEELARYCMIYMALLATEMGLRDNTQMAITGLVERMSAPIRRVVQVVAKLVVIAFSAINFWNSFELLRVQIGYGQTSPGLGIPMYLTYFALPLSFGIITLVQLGLLWVLVKSPVANRKEGTA